MCFILSPPPICDRTAADGGVLSTELAVQSIMTLISGAIPNRCVGKVDVLVIGVACPDCAPGSWCKEVFTVRDAVLCVVVLQKQ
uniref:PNPLA domain-containing protein n=1 Tax=Steinernema glaseri TaxID=37863 RepID=A0A1I7ZN23_9BILA